MTKEHNTIHIGHELDQPWIDASPGGLMLTPDTHQGERGRGAHQPAVEHGGKLKGKTVAVVGDKNNESRVNDVIDAGAEEGQGQDRARRAILNITGTDTTAAQAQVDSFIEKWKSEGVEHGLPRRQPRLGEAVRESRSRPDCPRRTLVDRHRHLARPGQGRAERRA